MVDAPISRYRRAFVHLSGSVSGARAAAKKLTGGVYDVVVIEGEEGATKGHAASLRMPSRSRMGGLISSSSNVEPEPQAMHRHEDPRQQPGAEGYKYSNRQLDEASISSTIGPSGAITVAIEDEARALSRDGDGEQTVSNQVSFITTDGIDLKKARKQPPTADAAVIASSGGAGGNQAPLGSASALHDLELKTLSVGSAVECRYKQARRGTRRVTASAGDGMFSVRYYDGEVEDGVVRRRLRRDGDFESRSLSLGETVDAKCCVSGRSIGSTAGGSPKRFLVLSGKVVDKVAAVGDKEDNGEEKYIVEFEAFAEHFDQLFCPAGHRATIPRKDIFALYHPAASSASPGESKQRT